jgi:membrane-associated protein
VFGVDIWWVCLAIGFAAFLGGEVGYLIGHKFGPSVFERKESGLFSVKNVERTNAFFERFGALAIILARFVPIVRTYVPFVAGVGNMPYLRYLAFCVAGAAIWVGSLCAAGYFFGNIPLIRNNLTIVILAIVGLSISPGLVAWMKARSVQREG